MEETRKLVGVRGTPTNFRDLFTNSLSLILLISMVGMHRLKNPGQTVLSALANVEKCNFEFLIISLHTEVFNNHNYFIRVLAYAALPFIFHL